ncbi:MAG TPA: hypothetical protein VF131_23815 [Blastocatellia bacterium]|nr:hypothetical protein [Blastocatellia bacterium]
MNVLDQNIDPDEQILLEQWRIRVRQIGYGVGYSGMGDDEIIPLLHQMHRVTFFSRDEDFFKKYPCHANYCLVHLDVEMNETAIFIRRFLRHPEFNTQAKRMGKVVRVSTEHIVILQLHVKEQRRLTWIK